MNTVMALQATVHSILEHPAGRQWSVQGFGMLRTYLDADKRFRLNIWDSSLAVPGVSFIHDHPWHFTSWILAGHFTNRRFIEHSEDGPRIGDLYKWATIRTGEDGGPEGESGECYLSIQVPEVYGPGAKYQQQAKEIYVSSYSDGTVTLNDRTRLEDGDHARVFWPGGTEWVDAEPRPAERDEVQATLHKACKQF